MVEMEIHGGDIYRNAVIMDFSVNVNPLGMPQGVKQALQKAVGLCTNYPDPRAEQLTERVSSALHLDKSNLLFGNGASELFMAIVHGINPKKSVVVVPSFYGYEHALKSVEGAILYYTTKEEKGFAIEEDIFSMLTKEIDVLFLANPNNPTGVLLEKEWIRRLLNHCKEQGIYVVLDECFIEFCKKEYSMLEEIKEFHNLVIVRAFTKIYAIAGVRLGYLICSNQELREKIKRQLPEWNLSCFAQEAGGACVKEEEFLLETIAYIKKEREYLQQGLKKLKLKIYPSEANFILLYSKVPLKEKLLKKGILIRDCDNFRGLTKGFYRIAVKQREDNERLLQELEEIV